MAMTGEKYDEIGAGYNRTRKADPGLLERMWHYLAPRSGETFLDIGCGTGNYTRALHLKGLDIRGVDPSEEMLNAACSHVNNIRWHTGKAENIPLENDSVNGVLASLTIHHWNSLGGGFGELHRVLKPGGRIVIFTSTPEQMRGYWLNHYFPGMLKASMVQMPSLEAVEQNIHLAGLEITATEKYFVQPALQDLFLYSGKDRPELYLDPVVRQGISSFSSLANAAEVKRGLDILQRDIENGEIDKVMDLYRNDEGDYLFIAARKPM